MLFLKSVVLATTLIAATMSATVAHAKSVFIHSQQAESAKVLAPLVSE